MLLSLKPFKISLLVFIYILIFILCFIWFTYHTTAIRYSSALLAFLLLILLNFRSKNESLPKLDLFLALKPIFIALAAITIWLYLHTWLFALKPQDALDAISNEWLKALLMGSLALLLIRYVHSKGLQTASIILVVILGLSSTILVYYIDLAIGLITQQLTLDNFLGQVRYPIESTWSEAGRDSLSTLVVFLLCFLIGELIFRIAKSNNYLPISNKSLYLLVFLCLLALFTLKTRLSQLSLIVIILYAIHLLYKTKLKKQKLDRSFYLKIVLGFSIIASLSAYNIQHDERWHGLFSSIKTLAFNTQDKLWLKQNLESAQSEVRATIENANNHSNYMRISMIRESIKTILIFPQGVGYGKNAFKKAVEHTQQATPALGSSHSGILEVALGAGIVGLALLMYWFYILLKLAYDNIRHPAATMLALMVIVFFFKNCFDQQIMDHYLEFFVFSSLLLAGVIVVDKNKTLIIKENIA